MNTFTHKILTVFRDPIMRKRIGFTIGALVLFRALATIPIPGVDVLALKNLLTSSQFFGFLNIFSGGGLSNLSIVMLGVGPFITASIVIQLLTMMFPSWTAMLHDAFKLFSIARCTISTHLFYWIFVIAPVTKRLATDQSFRFYT